MQQPVPNSDICALIDGECAPVERMQIESRLASAPQCYERFASWRRNDAALRFALRAALNDGAYARTQAPFAESPAIAPLPIAPSPITPLPIAPLPMEPLSGAVQPGREGGDWSRAKVTALAAFAGGAGAALIAFALFVLSAR